jgi:prefoldin subunit 5
MSCVLRTLLIASVASGNALGKTDLESLRHSASEARQRVADLRAQLSALQKQLDDLAPRIESLKQQRGLVPSGELKDQLRRSQDLSSQLTAVAQALAPAEADSQRRDSELLAGLSAELQRLEAQWNQSSSRDKRASLMAQMQRLREEREKLRASNPLREIPSVQPSRLSEEPEDLLRQADSLRDSEDKVRQQLSAIESRIKEVRDERALDRRMNEFLREQSLFDEQDRSYRLTPDQSGFQGTPPLGTSSPRAPGDSSNPSPPSTRAAEKPPQVDDGRRRVAAQASDTLESLESQRDKLRALAQQLHEEAQQLEQRARAKEQP